MIYTVVRSLLIRKPIVSEFISLDGVIQAPGGKDEDRDVARRSSTVRPVLDVARLFHERT